MSVDDRVDRGTEAEQKEETSVQAGAKSRPSKYLPTNRVAFEKQMAILRSVAIVGSQEPGPVTLVKAAKVVDLKPSSISLCAPFFVESRLWGKAESGAFTAAPALVEYERACQWGSQNAGAKLAAALKETWFAHAVLPILALQSKPRAECTEVLAEACGASVHYRDQLDLLLNYLEVSGLVTIDGEMVRRRATGQDGESGVERAATEPQEEKRDAEKRASEAPIMPPQRGLQIRLSIPHKEDAVIHLPEDFEAEDYGMLRVQLDAYMSRGFGWKPTP